MRTIGRALIACTLSIAIPDAAAAAPAIRIVARDNGYEAPERVPAGLRHVFFENRGSQIHESMFVKLPPGMTAADYEAAVLAGAAFPEGALDYSGPGLTSPGGQVEFWLTLDPGNYLLICWFSEHLATEHVHALTVSADDLPDDTPPPADVVVKLIDFRFELEGELKAGERVMRVENPGPSMHEVDIFRLEEGATLEDLRKWRAEHHAGKAPAISVGGALDRHDITRPVWLKIGLHPGHYVLWCGMPMGTAVDASSAVTHDDLGMVQEIAIVQ